MDKRQPSREPSSRFDARRSPPERRPWRNERGNYIQFVTWIGVWIPADGRLAFWIGVALVALGVVLWQLDARGYLPASDWY